MSTAIRTRLRPAGAAGAARRLPSASVAVLPGFVVIALMILWAVHDGGYDDDTWYWGALAVLGMLAATLILLGPRRRPLSRPAIVALAAFAAYVAWSYLSMTWAQVPGWALEGSNRALLYLLVFALFLVLPWTPGSLLVALLVYALGVGVIALVLLLRLASGASIAQLVIGGRLAAPTGYFNATVALFMTDALLATVLAARRDLPGLLRGTLVACASASLQLCVLGQSRGWLFTLPLVLLVSIALVRDRLRVAVVFVLPVVAAVAPVHQLLDVFQGQEVSDSALTHAASSAGRTSFLITAGIFVLATLLAWGEMLAGPRTISYRAKRRLGVIVTSLAVASGLVGVFVVTGGHPVAFVKRQWNGFSHESTAGPGSHFITVGSGRYDFWRVALDAVAAHPLGGLGQDNFADYYMTRRRTDETPRWTHSIEMRLLAHTGIVGFALFAAFLAAGIAAVLRVRRRGTAAAQAVAAAALLPLVVWLIHGSVDWLWEFPALSGPALGFLGAGAALASPAADGAGPNRSGPSAATRGRRLPASLVGVAGFFLLVACTVVLAFPYLSVRAVSQATDIGTGNPATALHELATAADLNPWSPDPSQLAGTIELQSGLFAEAQKRFQETIDRRPGGWFGWFGAGLAASELGERRKAERDFRTAAKINTKETTIQAALDKISSRHPLSAGGRV